MMEDEALLRTLVIEIFETINDINPKLMKDILKPKSNAKTRPFEVIVDARKTNKYGNKSVAALGSLRTHQRALRVHQRSSSRKDLLRPEYSNYN